MIKDLLETQIREQIPTKKCAVLLSGGVDSLSVALAAYNVGIKVIAYSFHLEGNESYDFKTAQKFSEQMGWTFKPTIVPTDNLEGDWYSLVRMGCKKKTHFECVFPFLYVYPNITEEYVLTGWGADGYFGVSKKAQMRYGSEKVIRDIRNILKILHTILKHLMKPETYIFYQITQQDSSGTIKLWSCLTRNT